MKYPHRDYLKNNDEQETGQQLSSRLATTRVSSYKPVSEHAKHRPVPDYGRVIDFENSSVLLFKIVSLLDNNGKNISKPEITLPLFRMYKKNPLALGEKDTHLSECFSSSLNTYKNAQLIYHDQNSIILEGGIKRGNVYLKREGDTLILEVKPMPGQMWTQQYDSFVIEHYFNGDLPGKAYEIHFRSDAHVLYYRDVIKKLVI